MGEIYAWATTYIRNEYRLKSSNKPIQSSCTTVSFRFYSGNVSLNAKFKLYSCQNLFNESIILSIYVLPCPIGFNLSLTDSRCVCDKKLKTLTQNCYICRNSESIERINSFWIYKASNEILILHEYGCPLDYCKDTPEYISLIDPSVQCDFNRTGIVCGKC